jgi:hypothetical protein
MRSFMRALAGDPGHAPSLLSGSRRRAVLRLLEIRPPGETAR